MGRSVLDSLGALVRTMGAVAKYSLAKIGASGWILAFRSKSTLTPVVMAFLFSFVLTVTVGTMVLPDTPRGRKPKPPAGVVPVTPNLDLLPGLPLLLTSRIHDSSKHYKDPVSPSAASEVTAKQDLKVNAVSKGSIGLRQTTAVAARPGGAPSGVTKVTGITLWGTPGRPWVSITASGPVQYRLRNVEPNWVVVDVSRAELAFASGELPAGRGLVRQVRVGQFTNDVVRVVLELAESVPFHVATSPDKTAIIVSFAAEARTRAGSVEELRRMRITVYTRPKDGVTAEFSRGKR